MAVHKAAECGYARCPTDDSNDLATVIYAGKLGTSGPWNINRCERTVDVHKSMRMIRAIRVGSDYLAQIVDPSDISAFASRNINRGKNAICVLGSHALAKNQQF